MNINRVTCTKIIFIIIIIIIYTPYGVLRIKGIIR